MIMREEENNITTKGISEVTEFSIKTSAKAFKILSQNLYSNPVGSVVRELSTNAYDSHVMAGCPERQFTLQIPTRLDPTFKIRDYGTGLSNEDMMSVYTTFFESTKTQSNDVVGCLGLGSKSPFAITDSFFVTSYFNGMKTIFSVFVDKNFIPSITIFATEETTEDNGLEIEIAVKDTLISSFAYEVRTQLRFFTVKPDIVGYTNFTWNEDTIQVNRDGWRASDSYSDSFAVQGQVAYPIQVNMISEYIEKNEFNISVRDLINAGYAVDFPIGSLDIAPSREALSYDDDTKKAIAKRFMELAVEVNALITEEIDKCPDLWTAKERWSSLKKTMRGLPNSPVNSKYDVGSRYISVKSTDEVKRCVEYKEGRKGVTKDAVGNVYSNTLEFDTSSRYKIVRVPEGVKHIDFKLRSCVRDERVNVYAIFTDMTIRRLKSLLGKKDLVITDFDDLNYEKPKPARKPKNIVKVKFLSDSRYYINNKIDCWNETEMDAKDITSDDYFVETNRFSVAVGGTTYEPELFVKALRILREQGFTGRVYGLNEKLVKSTKATSLKEYLKGSQSVKEIHHDFPYSDSVLYNIVTRGVKIPKGNILEKIVTLADLRRNSKNVEIPYDIRKIMNIYNITKEVETFDHSNVEADEAFKTYKILERFTYACDEEIEKTIAMIDFCNEKGFTYESK
jgi:hypothetical protein